MLALDAITLLARELSNSDAVDRIRTCREFARNHLMRNFPPFAEDAKRIQERISNDQFILLMWCYAQVNWDAGYNTEKDDV